MERQFGLRRCLLLAYGEQLIYDIFHFISLGLKKFKKMVG